MTPADKNEASITGFNSQAVIVYFFNYIDDELDKLHELDEKLSLALLQEGVGMYDGHEINMDGSDGSLYMYGENAEKIFNVVKPILEQADFTKGGVAVLRFGPIDQEVLQIEVEIARA
jgi:hypothetical protein